MSLEEASKLRLVQAFVSLTIAREAAEHYTAAGPAEPALRALINGNRLALELVEGLLQSEMRRPQPPPEPPVECAELLM